MKKAIAFSGEGRSLLAGLYKVLPHTPPRYTPHPNLELSLQYFNYLFLSFTCETRDLPSEQLRWGKEKIKVAAEGATAPGSDRANGASLRCKYHLNKDMAGNNAHIKRLLETKQCPGGNLNDANLCRFNLSKADLSGAKLVFANLSRTNLTNANLSGADVSFANLVAADLSKSDLSGLDAKSVNLFEAKLHGVNLSGADLSFANCVNANLTDANLCGADLQGSNSIGAQLNDANMSGARLTNANLGKAQLVAAILANADLTNVRLVDADLRDANLTGADLRNANLTGANLVGANLAHAKLDGAIGIYRDNPVVIQHQDDPQTPSASGSGLAYINPTQSGSYQGGSYQSGSGGLALPRPGMP